MAESTHKVTVQVVLHGPDGKNMVPYKLPLSDTLGKVMVAWCKRKGLRQDRVRFSCEDREVKPSSTPSSFRQAAREGILTIFAQLTKSGSSQAVDHSEGNAHKQPERIARIPVDDGVSLASLAGEVPVHICRKDGTGWKLSRQLRMNEGFGILMEAWRKQTRQECRFLYQGKEVRSSDTPESVGWTAAQGSLVMLAVAAAVAEGEQKKRVKQEPAEQKKRLKKEDVSLSSGLLHNPALRHAVEPATAVQSTADAQSSSSSSSSSSKDSVHDESGRDGHSANVSAAPLVKAFVDDDDDLEMQVTNNARLDFGGEGGQPSSTRSDSKQLPARLPAQELPVAPAPAIPVVSEELAEKKQNANSEAVDKGSANIGADLQGLALGKLKRIAREEGITDEEIDEIEENQEDPAQYFKDFIIKARKAKADRLRKEKEEEERLRKEKEEEEEREMERVRQKELAEAKKSKAEADDEDARCDALEAENAVLRAEIGRFRAELENAKLKAELARLRASAG